MWIVFFVLLILPLPPPVQAEYLGDLSANPFDSDSTANPFGAGSPFKPDGINNPFKSLRQYLQQPIHDESVRHRRATAPFFSVWSVWSVWFFGLSDSISSVWG